MIIQNDYSRREYYSDIYFEWLCRKACDKSDYNKLLRTMYEIEFIYILDRDENRAQDGINLRYQFLYENKGINRKEFSDIFDDIPCSILEMMVALAIRMESIMEDPLYEDRINVWFWEMVENLCLDNMDDSNFNQEYVEECLLFMMNREYSYNGVGGLFTVPDCPKDLKTVEIWYQMCWYLNTIQ